MLFPSDPNQHLHITQSCGYTQPCFSFILHLRNLILYYAALVIADQQDFGTSAHLSLLLNTNRQKNVSITF